MNITLLSLYVIASLLQCDVAQHEMIGVRGDGEAIAEVEAIVETMGRMNMWAQ
jgi:hypothetical protein